MIGACVLASAATVVAALVTARVLGYPGAAIPAATFGSLVGFFTPIRVQRRRS